MGNKWTTVILWGQKTIFLLVPQTLAANRADKCQKMGGPSGMGSRHFPSSAPSIKGKICLSRVSQPSWLLCFLPLSDLPETNFLTLSPRQWSWLLPVAYLSVRASPGEEWLTLLSARKNEETLPLSLAYDSNVTSLKTNRSGPISSNWPSMRR